MTIPPETLARLEELSAKATTPITAHNAFDHCLLREVLCNHAPALIRAAREAEDLRFDFKRTEERLIDALRQLRCPDCGCGDPTAAASKECGCDSIVCSLDGSKTLAEAYIEEVAKNGSLAAERDGLKAELHTAHETITTIRELRQRENAALTAERDAANERCKKVEEDRKEWADAYEGAKNMANGLFLTIYRRMTPYFPAYARDLEWDVLPSTIEGVCKERDAANRRVVELEEAVKVLADEAWAAHEVHCSGVSMKRKDGCKWFRKWHDAMDARKDNPIACATIASKEQSDV